MISRADSRFLKDTKDVFWPKKEKTIEEKIYDEILDAGTEANGYLCKIQDNNRIACVELMMSVFFFIACFAFTRGIRLL